MYKAIFPACVAAMLLTMTSAPPVVAEVRTGALLPEVTAAAWAVADGKTGELLRGHRQDEKRFAASTAKLMTTYVVLQMAEADSSILKEKVVLSEQAVAIPGSVGTLRVGEAVTVDDALHLVMRQSGDGFQSIKTGTYPKAGACLCARQIRGDCEFLVVVLGSKASHARYSDTRKLFDWASEQFAPGE